MLLELWVTAALFLLTGGFLYLSTNLPLVSSYGLLGPGFFPNVTATILFLGFGWHLLTLFRSCMAAKNAGQELTLGISKPIAKQLTFYTAGVIACMMLFNITGLLPTSAVLCFVTLVLREKLSWINSLLFTVAFVGTIHLTFVTLLQVPLPAGIFESLL